MTTSERLIERATFSASRVDAVAGLVRGVKILGLTSANGRRYTPEAIRRAASKYEGVRVNIDHAKRPGDPRSYTERFGRLSNVRVDTDGLYGDLHYNPKHAQAEQLAWDAANSPGSVGLSHTVDAKVRRVNGVQQVESIDKVYSVDLVADPATVAGLFESTGVAPAAPAGPDWASMSAEQYTEAITGKPSKDEMREYVDFISE